MTAIYVQIFKDNGMLSNLPLQQDSVTIGDSATRRHPRIRGAKKLYVVPEIWPVGPKF